MPAKIFLKIISNIGPNISPHTFHILYPVYIAINVNAGCMPICLLTNFGSKNCLTTLIITHKPSMATPSTMSPFKALIIAQGIIAVPEPSIGSASINPIPSAARSGNSTFNPTN